MNREERRRFLQILGSIASIGIAGCVGNGDDDDRTGEETTAEGESDEGGLVIEEHEFQRDAFIPKIVGTLLNDTGEEQSLVRVRATFFDENGTQIHELLGDRIHLIHTN